MNRFLYVLETILPRVRSFVIQLTHDYETGDGYLKLPLCSCKDRPSAVVGSYAMPRLENALNCIRLDQKEGAIEALVSAMGFLVVAVAELLERPTKH